MTTRKLDQTREDYAMHAANVVDLIAAVGRPFFARNTEHTTSTNLLNRPTEDIKGLQQQLALETKAQQDRLNQLLEFEQELNRQHMLHLRNCIDVYIEVTGADEADDTL